MKTFSTRLSSPIVSVDITADEAGRVVCIEFHSKTARRRRQVPKQCAAAVRQLEEYFRGQRKRFDLELAPNGTEFQLAVWRELQNIDYGTTISYGQLAARIGRPKASRAVGAANGQNPIPIVIPCHRVIGSNGSLTGFGGGLAVKRALLAHEGLGNSQLALAL